MFIRPFFRLHKSDMSEFEVCSLLRTLSNLKCFSRSTSVKLLRADCTWKFAMYLNTFDVEINLINKK